MVLAVKSNPEAVAVLKKCERQFKNALTVVSSSDIERFLIAHSGGLDSQVLLVLASRLLPSSKIHVVHINHHLQNEADSWAAFSCAQATMLSLAHEVVDVFPENSSENAARDARYTAFEQVIRARDLLLMGHHADDQAETLLFRMLRGAGLLGLSGMAAMRSLGEGALFRPLLKLSRAELEQVADLLELEYIDDPSNQDESYDRNYLRHRVMPLLKQRWPHVLTQWQKSAELMAESHSLLESYLESDLLGCTDQRGCLDLQKLEGFEPQKRRALLRHWIYVKTGIRINQDQLQVIFTDVVLAKVDANPVYILGGYKLRRFLGALYLDRDDLSLPNFLCDGLPVVREGEYDLGEGTLYISAATMGLKSLSDVVVKRRKGGERCRPQGKKHSVSVKKLLQEAAIPPWYREHWPLLYVGDQLVAVPSICICEGWYSEKSGFSVLWCSFSLSEGC